MQLKSISSLKALDRAQNDYLHLETDMRAKLVTYFIFGILGLFNDDPRQLESPSS
jgi:hypothetical protein